MIKTFVLFLLISCTSCNLFQEKGSAFKIVNNSGFPITDVKISTSKNLDSITFDSIAKGESREGFLSMKNNKTDGLYTLTYIDKAASTKEISGGYYTNGGNLDSYIYFEIQNDTTLVKFGEFPN